MGIMNAFLSIFTVTVTVFAGSFAFIWFFRQRDPAALPWSATLPVLGGPIPPTHAWTQYHMRYYPMALLFIAFEMEMMFMYPWAVVYVKEGVKALMEMGMFLTILSLGILYAWREGALRWQ
jgi:NADH-quinone oxidoreductase subunit A